MREYVKCMEREIVEIKAERSGGGRMRVQAYWNIHRKCWSVVALEGEQKGRVISHTKYVSIKDARLVVQEGGRQRVLKEKKKNVHAFVRGQLVSLNPPPLPQLHIHGGVRSRVRLAGELVAIRADVPRGESVSTGP